MTFDHITDAPISTTDVVFRESSWNKLIGVLITLALGAVPLVIGIRSHTWLLYIPAAMTLFVALFFFTAFRRTLGPDNWLLRYSPGHRRVVIKYRSYANAETDTSEPVAFALERDDVRWVRRAVERQKKRDISGDVEAEHRTYLEIGVDRAVAEQIEQRLAAERTREAPAHGPLHVRTKVLDYPVCTTPDGVIRVTWRSASSWITPSVDRALEALSQFARLDDPVDHAVDYASPTDPAEVDAKARTLLQFGDRLAALALVRRAYGTSLSDAQDYLAALPADTARTTTARQT